jgi:ATP-dependent RNA helicase DHX29
MKENGPVSDYKDTQHFVAVKALYQINPSLPLYRLFPPFYRDLWLSWLDLERKAKEDQEAATTDQRRLKIEELVQCIPSATEISGTQTENDGHEVVSKFESLPIAKPDGARVPVTSRKVHTTTALGENLKEQFLRRQETPRYLSMLKDRMKLPIYCYRQEILDTIRKNPVTILCAETGSGTSCRALNYFSGGIGRCLTVRIMS